MCHVPSSHSLSTRAVHTIVDGYVCHSGRQVERRQVSDDVYIVGQKQPASDLFSRSVAIHTFTHDVRRNMKVVVALSSF